jgi:hypothetical protein
MNLKSLVDKFVPQSLVGGDSENELDFMDVTEKEIEFVLVKFNEQEPAAIKTTVSDAIEIATQNGAIVEDLISSFVVLSFGLLEDESNAIGKGQKLSEILLKNLGTKVSILCGISRCLVGNHGSPNRIKFGSFNPDFWEHVTRLSEVEPGSKECICDNHITSAYSRTSAKLAPLMRSVIWLVLRTVHQLKPQPGTDLKE